MSTPPEPQPPRGLLDRWWRRWVDYPVPGEPFRSSVDLDLLAGLRAMRRFLTCAIAVLVAMFATAIAGYQIPSWVTPALSAASVVAVYALFPGMFASTLSVLLWQFRAAWAERWLAVGVPLRWLPMMLRSPLTPEQFAVYAVNGIPAAGMDPRLVWALTERGVTPEEFAAYTLDTATDLGHTLTPEQLWTRTPAPRGICPSAADVPLLVDAGCTPAQWRALRAACPYPTIPTLLRLTTWLRETRATLHPSQFPTPPDQPRTIEETIPVLRAWNTALGRRDWNDVYDCPNRAAAMRGRQTCPACGGRGRVGHRPVLRSPGDAGISARWSGTLGDWTETTGLLAPHFIAAGIDLPDARTICANDEPPTVEALATLAALRNG